MIRALAIALFALALAKVGLVHHLRMAGARDVVVATYGAQAIAACENADPAFRTATTAMDAIDLEIGDRGRSVLLWQVDHADWASRFRHVYLVVKLREAAITCRYDVATGRAIRT